MSLADEFISDLDRRIEEEGEPIRLLRRTTGPEGMRTAFESKMPAIVGSVGAPTDLLEPGARETIVVVSPTWLRSRRFPGLPRRDDGIVVAGDTMGIVDVYPRRVGGELVRVRLLCRG